VVLAVDRGQPLLDGVLAEVWRVLHAAGVQPADVTIVQPAVLGATERHDPRQGLPADVRDAVTWVVHDPTVEEDCGYLATSAAGERIYLSRRLLDADVVIPLTVAGYDARLGYQHPCGLLYPGLSNTEAFKKTHGQGHSELRPEDERPLRQLIDEAGWLLGVQYAVQVVPAARRGAGAEVLVGSVEGVGRAARSALDEHWRVRVEERVETVVMALPTDQHRVTWALLGRALETAKTLVERGGRIIVLTDLATEPGPGVTLIREQRSAKAALQPLRAIGPEDLVPATQWAAAADWATVYLLSGLSSLLVEELFCTPLENEQELSRLLAGVESGLVLPAAQWVHGEVGEA
jgi:nickel-dependent lactate racemase